MPPTRLWRRPISAPLLRGLFLLLIVLALASAAIGAWNGLHQSQDFQWSGARVLDARIDPWAEYSRGDPGHRFVLSQVPNYLALIYVLMSPLGLLSLGKAKLIWVLCNLLFAVTSGAVAARFYGLRGRGVVTVVCLLLMATPVRNSIGNGQQSLLVLLVWCLGLLTVRMTVSRAALAGISYGKFTFAPPVFLFLLFRWGWRAALFSLAPALVGLGVVWLWLTGGHDVHALIRIAGEPLAVAKAGYTYSTGDQNLMQVLDPVLRGVDLATRSWLELAVALTICTAISYAAFRRHRDAPVSWQIAVMATMSYGLFKHHSYDAVVLLFPLCHALRLWRDREAQIVLALIGYLFYGQRLLEGVHLHPAWAYLVEFVMLMAMLALIFRLREPGQLTGAADVRSSAQTEMMATRDAS